MKLVNMTIASIALLTLLVTNAHAGNRQVGGLVLGGGSGALVGQAVGRNLESTIVGATVGGVLGLIIGNELDQRHGTVNRQPQVLAHSQRYDDRSYDRRPRPVFRDKYRSYRNDRGNCRKIVTIKRGNHRTKRVIETVCGNNPRNHDNNRNRFRYNDRSYRY